MKLSVLIALGLSVSANQLSEAQSLDLYAQTQLDKRKRSHHSRRRVKKHHRRHQREESSDSDSDDEVRRPYGRHGEFSNISIRDDADDQAEQQLAEKKTMDMVKDEMEDMFKHSADDFDHEEQHEMELEHQNIDQLAKDDPEKAMKESQKLSTVGMSYAERYMKEKREEELQAQIQEKSAQERGHNLLAGTQSLASADSSLDSESERKTPVPRPIGDFAKSPPAQTEKTANLIANAIMHQ